jgi:hypothetical protein
MMPQSPSDAERLDFLQSHGFMLRVDRTAGGEADLVYSHGTVRAPDARAAIDIGLARLWLVGECDRRREERRQRR